MAKIYEEVVVIKLSKLIKDSDPGTDIATADIVAALQSVAEELAGAGVVVEAERAQCKPPPFNYFQLPRTGRHRATTMAVVWILSVKIKKPLTIMADLDNYRPWHFI